MSTRDLLESTAIVNSSEKPITAVQLGWIERDVDRPLSGQPTLGQAVSISLPPGGRTKLGAQGVGMPHRSLIVGVVWARFADGSEWSYPLRQRRTFVL